MSHMYDCVVSVVSKPSAERQDWAIESIIPWLMKKSDLFKDMKTESMMDIIRNCMFCYKKKDEVIITQGEKGNCFYIILRGSVSVYINAALIDVLDDFSRSEVKHKLTAGDREKCGSYMLTLVEGKSFGELALLGKDCVRNATIVTDEATDLLIVDRLLYNRCLRAAQEKEYNEKMDFVNTCPFFSNWQPKYKRSLAMSLVRSSVPFEGSVIKQGDQVTGMYFIISGHVKLVVDTCQTQPKLRGQPSLLSRGKTVVKSTEICIAGARELLGGVEVCMDVDRYLCTALCSEPCDVFLLDLKNFERLLVRKYSNTVDIIRDSEEVKLHHRLTRLTDCNITSMEIVLAKMEVKRKSLIKSTSVKVGKPDLKKSKAPSLEKEYLREVNRFIPTTGLLIDQYGPGTVFHRTRMRERARLRMKARFRNYDTTPVATYDDDEYEQQSHDDDTHPPGTNKPSSLPTHDILEGQQITDSDLSSLEHRIQIWQLQLGQQSSPRMVKLKRYEGYDIEPPKRGSKVIVHRREDISERLYNRYNDGSNYNDNTSSDDSFVNDGDTGGKRQSTVGRRPATCSSSFHYSPVASKKEFTKEDYFNLKTLLKKKNILNSKTGRLFECI